VTDQDDIEVRLTKKEIEVLTLIFQGKSSTEVGEELFISRRTVEFHLANTYAKLEVKSRMAAFSRLQELGMIVDGQIVQNES
jgi:ATP/maltotriose-dependent transcriptional regulator MalT